MSEQCRSCDRPATLALLGKAGNFDIYLCYGCLVETVKKNLRVKRPHIGDSISHFDKEDHDIRNTNDDIRLQTKED
jgi:hypothetical protein